MPNSAIHDQSEYQELLRDRDSTMTRSDEVIEVRFKVEGRFDGWRLDHFVRDCIPRLSRTRIQTILLTQRDLGGERYWPSMRVREGQEIVLLRPPPQEPDVPRDFAILYEDDVMMAVNKPAGLPVHATARFHRNTLMALLRERYPSSSTPVLAHRLDRETSGVILLAKAKRAEVILKEAFATRNVHKTYLAIVHGAPECDRWIDLPIGDDIESGIRVKQTISETGLPATTKMNVLYRHERFSLVEAAPETGRQHQIRVHLAAIGHSIVGDKLYGADPTLMIDYLRQGWNETLAAQLLLDRHALHAWKITFDHPMTREPLTITAPISDDLVQFWKRQELDVSALALYVTG